jgi:hypothetical protein
MVVKTIGHYLIPFSPNDLADRLSTQDFDENVSKDDIKIFCKSLNHNPHGDRHHVIYFQNPQDIIFGLDEASRL